VKLDDAKRRELLAIIREILPGAAWAPEEVFDEKTGDDPIHFVSSCRCEYLTQPAELTLFIKADGHGAALTNIVSRIEHVIEAWANGGGLAWSGCSDCKNRLIIDVRLFVNREVGDVV
jgi:hypothetical protein